MPPALVVPLVNETLIQTGSTWGSWTTRRMFARRASDGLCNDVGSAELYHPGGYVLWPGDTVPAIIEPYDIVGQYVRLLLEDPAGTVADHGKNFRPIWHGKVMKRGWGPNAEQTGLEVTYECAGLLIVLDQFTLPEHWELITPSGIANITLPLVFNGHKGYKTGNRSTAVQTIGASSAYVFDRNSGTEWTAQQAIEYLLATMKLSFPGGPTWSLAGATAALGYKDKWDLSGMNLLEMISRIISPRLGIGFRMEMAGANPTIHVMSLVATAVATTDYTLPASLEQVSLDLTDPTEIIDYSITEDQTGTYGQVQIIGGYPVYAVTLKTGTGGQIEEDWTAAERTDYDAAVTAVEPIQGALQRVGRRFKLIGAWLGDSYNGAWTMPTSRDLATSGLHGLNGYNGVLGASGALLSGEKFVLTRDLPVPMGHDWDTQATATADYSARGHEPLVFVEEAGVFSTLAEYVTAYGEVELESCEIQIDEKTGAITIGPASVAAAVLELLDTGGKLYFTVGIKNQVPLMVSWNRPAGEPTEQNRSVVRLRPSATQKIIVPGTAFRVEAGVLKTRAANTVIQDDVNSLRSALALAVAWYSRPNWEISWSLKGIISTAFGEAGVLYTDATLYTVGGTFNVPMGAVVSSREWDFSDGAGCTRISTKRIKLDIETVF